MGIMKRQVHMHSRSRCKRMHESKRKGRHTGYGKRKGTRNARMPVKILWMRKYRASKKIDKHQYHKFYLGSKGNLYKNKTVLIEAIHSAKTEKARLDKLAEE